MSDYNRLIRSRLKTKGEFDKAHLKTTGRLFDPLDLQLQSKTNQIVGNM